MLTYEQLSSNGDQQSGVTGLDILCGDTVAKTIEGKALSSMKKD
jgi:hypothetical protein